jgi:hypothetical protein
MEGSEEEIQEDNEKDDMQSKSSVRIKSRLTKKKILQSKMLD